jgi:putative methyltransferase (TIGR04325 family)
MPMRAKQIFKAITPPLLWNVGRDFKRRLLRSVDHFAYAPEGWSTRLPAGATSQDYWDSIIARERSFTEALIAHLQARAPMLLTLDEELKDLLFGYVLALAARDKPKLTVLDYGGSLGDYYWLGKALVPGTDLEYHCRELPKVAEAGRQLTPAVTWHTDDACLAQPHDLVMFSSSLQCLAEWQDILRRAAQSARGYLFLSDVATVRGVPTYVATQHTRGTTNLQNLLNRSEIVETVEGAGLRLVREFNMGPHPAVVNAPEQPRRVGWLFQRDAGSGGAAPRASEPGTAGHAIRSAK